MTSNENYTAHQALVTYQNPSGGYNSRDYYVEIHDFIQTPEGSILGEGKPLTYDSARQLAIALNEKYLDRFRFRGLIPSNVLYADLSDGQQFIIWHTPAKERELFFSDRLKIKNGIVHCPATLFIVKGNSLWTYALQNNRKPEMNTKVFKSPFHNVDVSGRVCMGSAKVKKAEENYYEELIANWECAFWMSKFSEIHQQPIKSAVDLTTFWKRQMKSKKPFPKKELIQAGTIRSIIQKIG